MSVATMGSNPRGEWEFVEIYLQIVLLKLILKHEMFFTSLFQCQMCEETFKSRMQLSFNWDACPES